MWRVCKVLLVFLVAWRLEFVVRSGVDSVLLVLSRIEASSVGVEGVLADMDGELREISDAR